MPSAINLLLPIKRKMIDELAHDDLREQSRSRAAALLQDRGKWCDHRHGPGILARDILAPYQPAFQEPRRFIVELLADFLADAAPLLRSSCDLFRIDDLFDDRQILGPAMSATLRLRTSLGLRVSLLQRGGGHRFSRRVLRLQ